MEQRQNWATRSGFVLAAIGSAVGLGNIWRFPYVAYENGGGAFLVPYLFALLTAGIPLLIMEFTIGHRFRGSAPLAFKRLSSGFDWLGWWQVLISFIIATYYAVVIAWALSYSFLSFGQRWGEDTQAYLFGTFLNIPENNWDLGGLQWHIVLPLVFIWLVSFIVLYNGVSKGIEKANKIFMPILLLLVVIITIRGITLPGAAAGLNELLTPKWGKLGDPQIWVDAYSQVFFSLSICFAIMVTYSGYLPKKSDINNNAFITAFANCGFSLLAALGVFGAIGFMATEQNVAVGDVAKSGVLLAFEVFPKIINQLPALNGLFGFLFFLSLVVAGISSLISIVNVVVQAVADKFNISYKASVVILHIITALLSLIYATGSGLVYLDIVDHFVLNHGVAISGLLEAIALAWIFRKVSDFINYSNPLSDIQVNRAWMLASLVVLTPVLLAWMIVQNIYMDIQEVYGGYLTSVVGTFGWGLMIASFIIAVLIKLTGWPSSVDTSHKEEVAS